jgi:hypothetical protein
MPKETEWSVLLRKQNVIIGLLARLAAGTHNAATISDQIAVLRDCGMKPAEIGAVLGKSASYVSTVLLQMSRRKGRKRNA